MFKSILVGIGAGFLAVAGPAIVPVLVAIFSAMGGALVIVGLAVWRAVRKKQRTRGPTSSMVSTTPNPPAPVASPGRAQWDVRP